MDKRGVVFERAARAGVRFGNVPRNRSLDLFTGGTFRTFSFPPGYFAFNGLAAAQHAMWAGGLLHNGVLYPTLFRVPPSGNMQAITIPLGFEFEPNVIIAGENDTVLATLSDEFCGGVLEITASGMGQFLASICAHPSGIAVGPDHNLYINLVDLTSFPLVPSTVAVLSKTGTPLARINLPDASTPQSIATGPDGNLWITLAGTNEIARMTTSGTLTFYPVPTANAFPPWGIDNAASAQIISGTDNDLWFVEGGANAIGRITTSGTPTEYAIPTAASAPLGISLCRPVIPKHECVWFTESAAGKIGELTL